MNNLDLRRDLARAMHDHQDLLRVGSYAGVAEALLPIVREAQAAAVAAYEATASRYVRDIWAGDSARGVVAQVIDVYEVLAEQEAERIRRGVVE